MKRSRKTLSILLMLMMVVTTLTPTWAFGTQKANTIVAGLAANDDYTSKAHVIVENTTLTKSAGAAWEGTLVDTWVDLKAESTAMNCITAALDSINVECEGADSGYISSINGLNAGTGSDYAGWMGTLNDWFVNEGFSAFSVADGKLKAGDEIRVMYSLNGGEDLGGSWSNNDKTVKSIVTSTGTFSPAFDKDTHEYTLTVPQGTESITVTPTASNKNFQVRTFIETTEYGRSDQIPVSDGTKITVKCGDPSWPSMNGGVYGTADSVPAKEYSITIKEEAEQTVKAAVTASFQEKNSYTMTPRSLEVDSGLAESYGYTDSVDKSKSVSALDVLVKMHEVMFDSDFSSDTKDSILKVKNGTITTIMGTKTTAASFAINEEFPCDRNGTYETYGYTGYTIDQAPIANGDSMDVFLYQDSYYMDYFTWFEQNGSKVKTIEAAQGEAVDLNLQGIMYAYCGSLTKEDAVKQGGLKGIEGTQLTLVDAKTGEATELTGAVTDEDGDVSVSFTKPGTYYISAYGDEYTTIVSPWLKVTVTSTAPYIKDGVDKTDAASVVEGEKYTLDLDTIFQDPSDTKLTYKVSVDGGDAADIDSKDYSVSFADKGTHKLVFSANNGTQDSVETYTVNLTVKSAKQLDFSVNVTPKDAVVKVYDSEGNEVAANEDGSFSGMFAESNYTYVVTKYGYVAQTGTVPKDGGQLTITLQKAADSGLQDVSSDWSSFRGSDTNMGITDAMTPISREDTTLLWNAKLGSGWSESPSVQIIADDALIVMVGKKIYKLNLKTGETLKTGTMAAAPSYSYTPPTYAEGMIFAPLGDGTIQAFNAKTLESLWIYKDSLKGQALSPITYSNGYIYTGFWNGEAKDAHYVCLSVTDEDITKTDEAKYATWVHKQLGGYYWAGSVAVGNYIIVGSDDGVQGDNGDSVLTSYDQKTGKIISELKLGGAGDQRSSIAYDKERGKVYFTTKGGYLCSAKVDEKTGVISALKKVNYNAQSTSTPVVYKGKVYFGVGSGFGSNPNQNFVAADAETLQPIFNVNLQGYPQCSPLLSTTYESEGYLYFYMTYNNSPGGISMIKVKNDPKSQSDAELIELYDAAGFAEYCISSIICDKNGTLYYKNDSGNVFAVGLPDYKTVINLIDRIGEVTLDSKTAIDTARKAYDALSEENKEKVTNYDKLVAAEKKLSELQQGSNNKNSDKNTAKTGNKSSAANKTATAAAASGKTATASGVTRSITKKATIKLGKMTEAAKAALSKLEAVVGEDLPKSAKDYTEAQIEQIIEAYKDYNSLSISEKKAIEDTDTWTAFTEITDKLGDMYHYDEESGVDVRATDDDNLPWYIGLNVTPETASQKQQTEVKDVLGGDGEIFSLQDISFVNKLDDSEWHPKEVITVKLPMVDIGSYDNPVIVHIADDGSIRLVEGQVDSAGGSIEFEASDFSMYGIAGSDESIDSLLGAQAAGGIIPWIAVGAAAAVVLIVTIVMIRRRNKGERYE